jgi:hypothetical protein
MNIDTLVESFYSKKDETESIINEVLTLLVGEVQAEALIREQREPITLSYDGVPDIPISEIPWSSVKTLEGGAEVPSPQRKQLEQFLDDIAGDDLKDKVEGLARFYETDPVQLLEQGFFGDSNKERISKALGYLTFYKTLTKIIAHFNASSAGFSFEAFLGVLLGGKQVPTGEGTIADLVTGDGTPVSLKLYTEGSLKVGGSFTDLVNDLRKFEKMQYVAVTKRLNDEKTAGRLDFYRFDFTLDNVGNIMLNGGLENPELMKLPTGFVENPTGFEDIEIPPPPKVEELVKIYEDRVVERGQGKYPEDILESVIQLVNLPEGTAYLTGNPAKFGHPKSKLKNMSPTGKVAARFAVALGLLEDEVAPKARTDGKEAVENYKTQLKLVSDIYNDVLVPAYAEVVAAAGRSIKARQELIARAGGDYLDYESSVEVYNQLPSPTLKKKALLLSHGYVNTDQFELTQPRVLNIDRLADPYEVFPPGQDEVKLGSIEVGQEQVINLMQKISEIIDASVFAIFEDLKVLTTNIQSYFGNGLQNDKEAQTAIEASQSIGERTEELKSEK